MTSKDSAPIEQGSSDLTAPVLALRDSTSAPEQPEASATINAIKDFKGAFWRVFFSTFITIFLAELGDKTQVATLLLSAESQSPVTVFLGAGLALVSTSLIGVLLGKWLSGRVSEDVLDTFAALLLMFITIGLVSDILGG